MFVKTFITAFLALNAATAYAAPAAAIKSDKAASTIARRDVENLVSLARREFCWEKSKWSDCYWCMLSACQNANGSNWGAGQGMCEDSAEILCKDIQN
ncbi:hypothetical protein HDV00_005102 [Rhizophlyctis rosea]|nr:hypothetical protein HDV00_005102 [Rhizophlyctis rosea]